MSTLIEETTDIKQAIRTENSLPPGLYEARLSIISPLTQEELNDFHDYLLDNGVDVKGCIQQRLKGLYQLRVQYRKPAPTEGIAWAQALIAIIPLAIIATMVGIGIFKLESISKALMPILLVGGGIMVVSLALMRKPIERVTEAYAKR